MTAAPFPLFKRIWLAFVAFFRVLFDASVARGVERALTGPIELAPSVPAESEPSAPTPSKAREPASAGRHAADEGALGLLSLFQREGRLVDFLEQEIESFADADIGAATRVVHSGCRKALLGHFDIERVRQEAEGAQVTIPDGYDGQSVKLVGNVRGAAPYRGVLRHGGWRARAVRLPEKVAGHDSAIIMPAEVEL